MPLSRARDYMSIGEVLDALKGDFPDTSISKIRFLESEGLISPERTGSGYRKFYDQDVERLRYILSLQRDHFLPLKVIKERIASGAPTSTDDLPPTPAAAAKSGPAKPSSSTSDVVSQLAGVQMDRAELLKASGLTSEELGGLEEYGILSSEDGTYDEDHLVIATAARGFFAHGVEARHLRLYRQTTDREAAFIEQILAPSVRLKDPQAQKKVGEEATKLAHLSRSMRDAMLRATVKSLF